MVPLAATTRMAGLPERQRACDPAELEFQQLKPRSTRKWSESLDLSEVGKIDDEQLRQQFRSIAEDVCRVRAKQLSRRHQERMVDELLDEVFGLGPLERYCGDPSVATSW